jgi:hypothetical protein
LQAPAEERDGDGKRRRSGGRSSKRGTPQGGVVSPLLSVIYMNRFLKHWRLAPLNRHSPDDKDLLAIFAQLLLFGNAVPGLSSPARNREECRCRVELPGGIFGNYHLDDSRRIFSLKRNSTSSVNPF